MEETSGSADIRPPLIDVQRVSVVYAAQSGGMAALEEVSLSIEQGAFVCVVGPSGSGKTTLLRLMAGFMTPTEGRVLLDGSPITGPGADRGVVFQSASLFPWLTVRGNVEFGPRSCGVAAEERRRVVEESLRLVRLWDVRDSRPYELSGGMRQRVAIARVLANRPRVLLMDEPLGALDALTREHLQEELLEVWRTTGTTVVFITHSVEEAVFLATRIVVLSPRPGRIVQLVDPPFSRGAAGERGRAVKRDPAFVELREEVLGHIWET